MSLAALQEASNLRCIKGTPINKAPAAEGEEKAKKSTKAK
jgi:hypothetical protein